MASNWLQMEKLTQATLDQVKAALTKQINTSTGLTGFDLTAPAYEIYPVLTPVRNALPRTPATVGSTASNWKQITAITVAGKPTVSEGLRNAEIGYTATPRSAAYKSYGRDDSVTREAESQGRGFEDLRALSTASLLRRVMIDEEDQILGGNTGLALGTTGTPTLSAGGTGATLPAATYSVIAVALPYWGWQYRTASGALAIPTTGAGWNAQPSANATQAITLGQTLTASVAVKSGALGYAWYVGTAGSEKLEKFTNVATVTFSAPLAGTGQAATAIAASDNSTDPNDFDGMFAQLFAGGSGAQIKALANGALLTADSAGGVPEVDALLQALWDSARLGPDIAYCNSQQIMDLTKRIMANPSGAGAYRVMVNEGAEQANVVGGAVVQTYVNKFTGSLLKFQVHPTMPPGTILFVTNQLPDWYAGVRPPGAWDLHMIDEYYEIVYGQVQRKWEHGVYARGVLRGFLPMAQAILTNITPG